MKFFMHSPPHKQNRDNKVQKEHLAGRGTAGTPSGLVVACGKGTAKWHDIESEICITAENGLETCVAS